MPAAGLSERLRVHRSRLTRAATISLALLSLASTGCGLLVALLSGLAVAAVSDAVSGKKKHSGSSPTVLVVRNDPASTDTIIEVDVARVDGAEPPTSNVVGSAPGFATTFTDVFDPGAHWVRVVYASGWHSRAKSIDVVSSATVTVTFIHAAPNLAAVSGTWFGATERLGVGHTYGLTLSAVGAASGRTLDGVADASTGTLVETSEGVYRLTWSDARVIALIADALPSATHAALVSDDSAVGVLERGATPPLPAGVAADVVGTWTGVQVEFSGLTLTPVDVDAASATVSALFHWEGHDGSGISTSGVTTLAVSNAAFLRYFALVSEGATPTDLAAGLTADRAFGIFALTPSAGGTFPDATTFQLLAKGP
jgi:hypothetical protein